MEDKDNLSKYTNQTKQNRTEPKRTLLDELREKCWNLVALSKENKTETKK